MKKVLLFFAAALLLAAGLGGCAMQTAQEQNIPAPKKHD